MSGGVIERIHRTSWQHKNNITFTNRNNIPYTVEDDDNSNGSIYHPDNDDVSTDKVYDTVNNGSVIRVNSIDDSFIGGVEINDYINEDDDRANDNTENSGDYGCINDSATEGNDDDQVDNNHPR